MSSFMFYSSPPTAPYQSQTSFFTPQTSRSNLFATSHSQWSYFQPKSPSPLRSSPNTGNSMRIQDQHGLSSKQAFVGDEDENRQNENAESDDQHRTEISHADLLYNTPINNTGFTTSTPKFAFNAPAPARNPFTFQQRARESTANSQVSSRISGNRDARKAGFIDRLRRSRRDERDARGLDSFEKAEYWRERKDREMRLCREAAGYEVDAEADSLEPDFYDDDDDDEADLSPVDDDKEVDDLVNAFYSNHEQSMSRLDNEPMSDDFGMDDEGDYAEAFLEVLSQEHRGMAHELGAAQSMTADGGLDVRDNSLEGDMDVS